MIRPSIAAELFRDTSGFFARLNTDDPTHRGTRELAARAATEGRRNVTSDWIVGECCTLPVARRKPHLVPRFLDHIEGRRALVVMPSDEVLMEQTKAFLRRHLDHAYSFVDCTSFVIMAQRKMTEAVTTDRHFAEAGFTPLL